MMKSATQASQQSMKACSLCNQFSNAEGISLIHFGEWMSKKEITVHYYCLLLSTNLPQRGEDCSGILGFFLRDIRLEIYMAKKRKCKYCFAMSATIQCVKCKEYFHLTCGHTSKCLSEFVGEFKSYCHACIPVDQFQAARKSSLDKELCFICAQVMGTRLNGFIYAKCCGNGFTHSKCMKIYALNAGYYLRCIWCKDKRFREDVKYQGVFVPDRDANWEKRGAYGELYRSHKRCDMELCNCPKGRDYSSRKWQLITCKLCGSFGAHNPACIPGFEISKGKLQEFKCDTCSATEKTCLQKTISGVQQDLIDTSLYINKDVTNEIEPTTSSQVRKDNSLIGDINSQEVIVCCNSTQSDALNIEPAVYTLTQCNQTCPQEGIQQSDLEMEQEEASDSDSSAIADLLVQKLLDAFN